MKKLGFLLITFTTVGTFCQSKPTKPSGLIKAIAYRIVPGQQTTYYQFGQQSSQTTCFASSNTFGNFGTTDMNCDTQYTNPTQIPFTWKWADVYNIVETDNAYRLLIGCRAAWRWSKCAPLVPGDLFQAEVKAKGRTLTVFSYKDGNPKKKLEVNYQVLGSIPLN